MQIHRIPRETTEIFFRSVSDRQEASFVLGKNSRAIIILFASGAISENPHVVISLEAEGAHADIIGMFSLSENSKVNLKTVQHHKAQNTKSNLLVKTVLRDNAEFKYDGAIRVEKEGQRTDAYQRNENLLLSEHSWAESKPSLEILANDVRCTHGATISSVNEEQRLYLQSRGISKELANNLLISGFLFSAMEKTMKDIEKSGKIKELWQNIEKYFPFLSFPTEA